MYEKKCIFINLFNDIKIMNKKKENILIFFIAMNIYQSQSWNYSWWNFYQCQSWNYSWWKFFLLTPELELFMGEFLPTLELELFEIEYSLAPESVINV